LRLIFSVCGSVQSAIPNSLISNYPMNQYMVEVWLPEDFTADMMALVPQQRMVVNQMMRRGRLRAYTLSADRRRLWLVLLARDEQEAAKIIDKFPMSIYMTYEMQPLMFHESIGEQLPSISMN
jgi:muconolactone delta-isomerase